ncbi:MAG: hypothetical protein CMO74_07545 [Verrucomicrobiales bacterium]|nr:hypothetical protein [Verrucomicrobiales bacterium]|tara:strand:+ start:935 stop:4099 length:3165 start_codon:yes stop_codon:yes gene_type:complete
MPPRTSLSCQFAKSIGLVFLFASTVIHAAGTLPEVIDFNRDIRPILADTCYTCHGPDNNQRKAKLRLDQREGLFREAKGVRPVVAGDLIESELFARITSTDPDEQMPPRDSQRKLSAHQIALIKKWIEQGAKWQGHWAFITPKRPALPKVKDKKWPRNGIDHFILARLEREGLGPSAAADRATLLRRVSLDLTGLPPTPGEVSGFLLDKAPDAYEKAVDRLLASPRYGERMAFRWLDAARYSDTSGYQTDGPRTMWRWRDWVIEAFNDNMHYDRFTIEQLAGDLLPNATLEQRIATGFNRNHRGNAEGGSIPEEFQVEYVVDRVDTTATVWMGLTLGCARCHEHKYDPFTQKEFYELYAFFNNIPENGRALKYANSPPFLKTPTRAQMAELALLTKRVDSAEDAALRMMPEVEAKQREWEKAMALDEGIAPGWAPTRGLVAHLKLDEAKDMTFIDGKPVFDEGRVGNAAVFDGRRFIDANATVGEQTDFGYFDKFTLSLWVRPESDGALLTRTKDEAKETGWGIWLVDGKVQVNFVKRWLDDSLRLETIKKLKPRQWHHIAVTFNGHPIPEGVRVFVNGRAQKLRVNLDMLNQDFAANADPLRIGAGGGPVPRFKGAIDEVRIYNRPLYPHEAIALAAPDSLSKLASMEKQTAPQREALRLAFLEKIAPKKIRDFFATVRELREERAAMIEKFPTTMVMHEMAQPRSTRVLIRGAYDNPGEQVTAGTPVALPAMAKNAPRNRLGFARWLTDPKHPLTARVTVNQFWQMYFGRGIVKTVEDFGSQGAWPSHPQLLDWLATEFVRTGWDVKAMQKLIVTSATYRQSSARRKAEGGRVNDPENILLSRGPRMRLSADMIRDQALFVSGLLQEKVGGPSVKPYQPKGLWKEIASDTKYEQAKGADLYRRSLYTFWKRTVTPPLMATFDASPRETCVVRETRTSTPLQALALMNDVIFVEAARVFAQRMIREGGETPEGRIRFAFYRATSRNPKAAELKILSAGLSRHLGFYHRDTKAAKALVAVGESPVPKGMDAAELAAYTVVASLILNLDEVITKQ